MTLLLIASILSSTVYKIFIALNTEGTNDVTTWKAFADGVRVLDAVDMYHHFDGVNNLLFNHPPFMIFFLQCINFLTDLTGLKFEFWLRIPSIIADVGIFLLVWRFILPNSRKKSMIILAFAPPSIIVSGFHGNTDSIMILWLIASLCLLSIGTSPWIAGMALGMSINIKIVPLLVLPALVLSLASLRAQLSYLSGAIGVVVIASIPLILSDHQSIIDNVLRYKSNFGIWGVSRIISEYPPLSGINDIFFEYGNHVLALIIVLNSIWLNRRANKPPLFFQCGLIFFLLMTIAPGFGTQYLVWLVPWIVALGLGPTLLYYATSGVFLFAVYTTWSRGFPWHYADAALGWGEVGHALGWLCWFSVLLITLLFFRAALHGGKQP